MMNVTTETSNPKKEEQMTKQKKKTTRVRASSTNAKCEEKTLALAEVQMEEMFRRRLKEDEANIEKLIGLYSDNMSAEAVGKNPPHRIDLILVWYDAIRGRYVLLGGYHRLEALRRLGMTTFQVEVLHGSEDDAFAAASRDNAKHGKELKDCDKKYSVIKSLKRYGDTKSHREIAGEVGCVHSYVSKIYKELFGRGKRQGGKKQSGITGAEQVDNVPTNKVTDTDAGVIQSETPDSSATSDGVPAGTDSPIVIGEKVAPDKSEQEQVREFIANQVDSFAGEKGSPRHTLFCRLLVDWLRKNKSSAWLSTNGIRKKDYICNPADWKE